MDASESLTKSDFDCAQYLRKSKKPLVLIAHKADRKSIDQFLMELHELGLGEAVAVSSIHNFGIPELEETTRKILKKMKWRKERPQKRSLIQIAIVGKPNVGKSSLVNALLGEPRLIVSEKPGTTIDATDTPVHTSQGDFVLIDTAGLRRRGKVRKGIERYGTFRALAAISRSDVTCLVLDYENGIANQDLHVSEYILDAGKGLVVVVNKCDLMEEPEEDRASFLNRLSYRMNFIPWAPVLFISALTKKNIGRIYEVCLGIASERKKSVPEAQFQVFTKTVTLSHPPDRRGRDIIITKGKQSAVDPPTFTFYTNYPDLIHFSYRRYLENEIRRKYGFHGTGIRLEFRKS
jgi:GTP-binding protein